MAHHPFPLVYHQTRGTIDMPEETNMLPNAFIGKLEAPTANELTAALGAARAHWDELLARLAAELNLVVAEWNSYSPKAGWALRLKMKKRNIVYFAPCQGGFIVTFVLGDRAVEAARQSTLPRRIVKLIEEGKRYPEGTAIRTEMTDGKDIPAIVKLAAIKLRN
jgi:hypothetical protein